MVEKDWKNKLLLISSILVWASRGPLYCRVRFLFLTDGRGARCGPLLLWQQQPPQCSTCCDASLLTKTKEWLFELLSRHPVSSTRSFYKQTRRSLDGFVFCTNLVPGQQFSEIPNNVPTRQMFGVNE